MGGGDGADARACEAALEVGRELGRRGAVLLCGGLGGVMEAACRGAREHGAITVGLLPGTDRHAANPHVCVAVATGIGEVRNALVVRSADAVIAVGGGFGTLSEIALALKAAKPVVGISTWELARQGRAVDAVELAAGPADAVARALGERTAAG